MKIRFLTTLAAVTALIVGNVAAAATRMTVITIAAQDAQRRCYAFMHEDADEFVSCINALDRANKRTDADGRYRQLGIHYFGWAGANNSARVALPGADDAAQRYFARYQAERRGLGIDEGTLCAAVAGDCTSRLAQIAAEQVRRSARKHR